MNTTIEQPTDRHLHAVPDPADTCPVHPWCVIDHTDPHDSGNCHYSDSIPAGPVSLRLDLDASGRLSLEIVTEHADGDSLSLDHLDALIARLNDLRPTLAAATLPAGVR